MSAQEHNKRLRYSRRLSFVPRWSVMPTVRQQNVAEHTFHVAQAVLWLLPMHASAHSGNAVGSLEVFRLDVLTYALRHDENEAVEGDMPSPRKAQNTEDLGDVDQIKVIVKVADILEAIGFVYEEKLLGNNFAMDLVMDDLRARLHPWWGKFDWAGTKRKPITSDLVQAYLAQVCPAVHPVLEGVR